MRRVTVKLDDKEMAQIETVARARQVDPAALLKAEALKIARSIQPAAEAAAVGPQIIPRDPIEDATTEQRRQARLAVLMRSNGIFAGEPNTPKDGLIYQRALRAEWQ